MQAFKITFIFLFIAGIVWLIFRKQLAGWYQKSAVFLKEVKMEMSKVTWPTKNEIISYTVVVIVTVVILSIIIGVEDFFLGKLLEQFIKSAV